MPIRPRQRPAVAPPARAADVPPAGIVRKGTIEKRTRAALARIFPTLSPTALGALAAAGRVVAHPVNVSLCREGEIESRFYIVIEGRVDVFKGLEGERHFINHLGPGEHFGEIALLLDLPRTATIVTSQPSRVFEVDRTVFNALIQAHSEAGTVLSQMVLRRFLAHQERLLFEIARLKKGRLPRPPRVFLSYARVDVEFATRLANNLLQQEVDVWIDIYRLEPGRSWARQVGEALDSCQEMLVILSPASVASGNVEDEWNYYLDQKKVLVPVLYQPCRIPYRLSKFQYLNFHQTDYDLALARLVATLNTPVSAPR